MGSKNIIESDSKHRTDTSTTMSQSGQKQTGQQTVSRPLPGPKTTAHNQPDTVSSQKDKLDITSSDVGVMPDGSIPDSDKAVYNKITPSDPNEEDRSDQPSHAIEPEPTGMNRDVISGGEVQRLVRIRDGAQATILDDDALLKSRRSFIPDDGLSDDLLVFGYGSLIWNPCMKVKDQFPARVFGLHRRFCLKSTIGRGSPEAPGLVLALDYGGSVSGVCFQIDKADLVREADLLWRREMLNGSYAPKWVKVKTPTGTQRALTFIIDRDKPAFTPRMTTEETAEIISRASGFVGSNAEYLMLTQQALLTSGIKDPVMAHLVDLVSRRLTDRPGDLAK